MNLLLDTQALLWWRAGSKKLGPTARTAIERQATAVYVSSASAWEIAIKLQTGRLALKEPLQKWMQTVLETSGFDVLLISIAHAVAVTDLPAHHADPFDRLLIAQAKLERLTVVTSDTAFDAYDVPVLNART